MNTICFLYIGRDCFLVESIARQLISNGFRCSIETARDDLLIKSSLAQHEFDMILLDQNMIDGREKVYVTRILSNPHLSNLPRILLVDELDDISLMSAMKIGAAQFIPKTAGIHIVSGIITNLWRHVLHKGTSCHILQNFWESCLLQKRHKRIESYFELQMNRLTNLLTMTMGYSEMGFSQVTPRDSVHPVFRKIFAIAEKMEKELSKVRKLLNSSGSLTLFNFSEMVDETVQLLAEISSLNIFIYWRSPLDNFFIHGNRSILQEIIFSICDSFMGAIQAPIKSELAISLALSCRDRGARMIELKLENRTSPVDLRSMMLSLNDSRDQTGQASIQIPLSLSMQQIIGRCGGLMETRKVNSQGSSVCLYFPFQSAIE
jgi:DNA-binding NarL/FixJ family response regulator